MYEDKLPVGFLGLVDDIVGITEVEYKAQELNAFINLKTAEKSLQFGDNANYRGCHMNIINIFLG